MSSRDVVLSMQGVAKKFRRGEMYDSLRTVDVGGLTDADLSKY